MSSASPTLTTRTTLLALAGVWALTGASAGASAPEGSESLQTVIEMRQQGFKKMGAAMKAIIDQLKSAAPDNARMTAAAQAISSGAGEQFSWFPAGSGADDGMETDALPHIWEDRAKFDSIANQLISESKKLVVAMSGTDPAAARAQAKVVGDVCATCHRSFRAD
jgi:cytochrome c556